MQTISGRKIDFDGPDYLKAFWQSVREDMEFLACFDKAPGKPFLYVSETKKPVGTIVKHQLGHILFLPWLLEQKDFLNSRSRSAKFLEAFSILSAHIAPKKSKIELPAWSVHYGWSMERELRKDLTLLQSQAEKTANDIKIKTADLEKEDALKVLFTGKGDVLVDIVINIFEQLGVKAKNGETGRDDIILEFDGKNAVIEVKGKKGSAAESDAAQLEKWVAGFKAATGADAKGILLVDAYSETPLAERTEPAFPHQMLKYSTLREHCLLTTTQLLGVLLEARTHPEKRKELIDGLFSTIGIYPNFSDWKSFLSTSNPPP